MDNPFEKRATDYTLDPLALLPLVSPEPIEAFFNPQKRELFQKMTIWAGTPGCGKTTIARILEFDSLWALSRANANTNTELAILLSNLGILEDGIPNILAHRIPMTTNFRAIWELPYDANLKQVLLRSFVQSKAVLGWLRQIERAQISFSDIEIVFRDDSESARAVMKSDDIESFRNYAREIELSVFKVVTALVPPNEDQLANEINSKYDIFEEIRGIKIKRWPDDRGGERILRLMTIIDDAHELHPAQFATLRDWLKSRVIGVSRWIMCRLDVIAPEDYSDALKIDVGEEGAPTPGSSIGRDYYVKLMQLQSNTKFRKVAMDIGNRYFSTLPAFARKSVKLMGSILNQSSPHLAAGQIKQLTEEIEKLTRVARISSVRIQSLKTRIPTNITVDEQLGVLRILVNREINNSPQLDLLGTEPVIEQEPEDLGHVRASVIDGARIQLMHEFKRPYYYGIEKLADASNNNIEQFISLAGPLVNEFLTKIIRGKSPELNPISQHQALQRKALETMNSWDFPYHDNVRTLVSQISSLCLAKTLLPYAPLDDGANAYGVLQEDMDNTFKKSEKLARVLHFAFAYKALVMVPQYKCKNKVWCLLELGGIPTLASGLTLSRGGFVEGKLVDLESQLQ